ncbi:VOC family protein [Novosphingobium bradum]|uniref:VOC family protein n=1 Tax=Novosphingobium bradum TaxID=1737444 RepID=A0ABV7IQ06_9SPHN
MSNPVGSFIWYELMTSDAAGAAAFYGAVVGWRFTAPDAGAPIEYWHIGRSDGGSAGGMLQLSPEMLGGGARPAWLPYLNVADVDREVAAIQDDGGHVLMPKMTIPVGSMALVTDPQGAPFYVMTPVPPADNPQATSDVFSPSEAQHVRWNELSTSDPDGAKAFYAFHFGFEFNNSMPMGAMGSYDFIDHHGQVLGAVMRLQDPAGRPQWLPYFGVPSATAAEAAILAGGGTVIAGPHEVPGGDWVVMAVDPQGAAFGVVGPRGE